MTNEEKLVELKRQIEFDLAICLESFIGQPITPEIINRAVHEMLRTLKEQHEVYGSFHAPAGWLRSLGAQLPDYVQDDWDVRLDDVQISPLMSADRDRVTLTITGKPCIEYIDIHLVI